jgi:hypothetical protein
VERVAIRNRIAEQPPKSDDEKLPLLFTEKMASKFLGVSLSFLRKGRSEGKHHKRTEAPEFIRVEGRVYYAEEDLRLWVRNLVRKKVI